MSLQLVTRISTKSKKSRQTEIALNYLLNRWQPEAQLSCRVCMPFWQINAWIIQNVSWTNTSFSLSHSLSEHLRFMQRYLSELKRGINGDASLPLSQHLLILRLLWKGFIQIKHQCRLSKNLRQALTSVKRLFEPQTRIEPAIFWVLIVGKTLCR